MNTPPQPNPQPPQYQQQQSTYASIAAHADKMTEEHISPLKSLIDEFKTLITQLMNQNTMILSLLTTLINKHN
jgi:Mg2+ and Co2+ transporter CorA